MSKPDFDKTLTIYGRNSVFEALQDSSLSVTAVHLADSNRPSKIIDQITAAARARNIPILHKTRLELSRISRNKKQDQGVAADVLLNQMQSLSSFTQSVRFNENPQFIALEGVTNPQNVGMIIRSVAASGIAGLILPRKGCADIGPLVIKASAGAVFKCPIIRCDSIQELIECCQESFSITTLDLQGRQNFAQVIPDKPRIFVLGNETDGVSDYVTRHANERLCIPMANEVESLNVAVTAAILAFKVNNRN